MAKQPKQHCTFIKEDGSRCGAYQAKGTEYCIGHGRKLGVIVTSEPLAIEMDSAGLVDTAVAQGYVELANELRPKTIAVDEPEVLKALRSTITQIEMGGSVDAVVSTQLANILRPYFGAPAMDGIELASQIDRRAAADEQIAKAYNAKMELINQSRALVVENPDPRTAEQIEAKVNRDIQAAATDYRTKLEFTRQALMKEPRAQVAGTGQDEIYVINGVKIVIPAEGLYSVPSTIAQLHRQRLQGRKEKMARSNLMQSVPEYSQVYQKMAEIDRSFGSRSQLGGGPSQEQDDFLVAEEIK